MARPARTTACACPGRAQATSVKTTSSRISPGASSAVRRDRQTPGGKRETRQRGRSMNTPWDGKLSFIFGRRSIRRYQDAPVSDELVGDLLRAAMAAPSACAKDPWRFVVVRNRATLNLIADALPNGKMLAHAPVGIAVCGDLGAAHAGDLSYLFQDCS